MIPFGNAAQVVLRFHSDLLHSNSRGFHLIGQQLPCYYPPPPTIRPHPHPYPPTIRPHPYPPPTIRPPTPTPGPVPPPDRCDVIFNSPLGQLQSPNYPGPYAPLLACQFRYQFWTTGGATTAVIYFPVRIGSNWRRDFARWNFPSRISTWRTAEAATKTPSSSDATDTAPIHLTINEVISLIIKFKIINSIQLSNYLPSSFDRKSGRIHRHGIRQRFGGSRRKWAGLPGHLPPAPLRRCAHHLSALHHATWRHMR